MHQRIDRGINCSTLFPRPYSLDIPKLAQIRARERLRFQFDFHITVLKNIVLAIHSLDWVGKHTTSCVHTDGRAAEAGWVV